MADIQELEFHEEAYTTYEPLDELLSRHHPENPKDHDVGSLIESIQEFGFVRNVMVNETDGLLLYGHGTTEALWRMYEDGSYEIPKRIKKRKDGMWLVPTDRGVEISEERAMAYVIADNRHAELGGWNEPRLVDNLIKIAGVDGGLKGTGFDGDDLDKLIELTGHDMTWEGAFGRLPEGERAPFQQIAFTLHDDQIIVVKEALDLSKSIGNFDDYINENSNGNALFFICENFMSNHGKS